MGLDLEFSSRVQAVCDFRGPTDLLQIEASAHPNSLTRRNQPESNEWQLVGGSTKEPIGRAKARQANPIAYVSPDDPPILIVHGDQDTAVPYQQSELLFSALKSAGVPANFHIIKGGPHGIVGAGKGTLVSGPEVPALVAAFFDYPLQGITTAAASWPKVILSSSMLQPDRPEPAP